MTQTHSAEQIREYMLVYYGIVYAVVWYDWAVCLPKEYRKIWRAERSLVKLFYLANRYSMLALTIAVFAGFGMRVPDTQSDCKSVFRLQSALPILVYFFSGIILIMRCFAIWGRNKVVAAFLMTLHVAHVSISGWTIVQATTLPFSGEGPCVPKDTKIMSAFYTCFSAIVFDLVASGLAIYKSCQIRKQYHDSGVSSAVLDNIIRNGTVYIIASALVGIVNMAFRFLSDSPYHTPMDGYAGGNLCVAINSILSARLVLSLKVTDPQSRATSHLLSSSKQATGSPSALTAQGETTLKGSTGSKTLFADTGVSQVAVTISTETHVDSPTLHEEQLDDEKRYWRNDSDLEMQSLDKEPRQ